MHITAGGLQGRTTMFPEVPPESPSWLNSQEVLRKRCDILGRWEMLGGLANNPKKNCWRRKECERPTCSVSPKAVPRHPWEEAQYVSPGLITRVYHAARHSELRGTELLPSLSLAAAPVKCHTALASQSCCGDDTGSHRSRVRKA